MMPERAKTALGIGVSGYDVATSVLFAIKKILEKSAIRQIDVIATLDRKAHHPLLAALAMEFKADILLFPVTTLAAQQDRLTNPCQQLYERMGCHGVAEAAALAASGSTARLVIPKTICHKMTFAVADARAFSEKCEAVFG